MMTVAGRTMMNSRVPILLLSALCLAVPWQARADVYKWVDEKGVVNYGDAPPQRATGVRPLDLKAGSVGVLPGIPREELERMRARDTQMRLRQLEAEVEELRAREAAQAAAPVAAPTEPSDYGYAGYWYGWTRPQRPGSGRTDRSTQPVATPLHGVFPTMPKAAAPPSSRRPPGPNQWPDAVWKR